MKNLKYMSLLMTLMCVSSLGFTSCGDDDDKSPAPQITLHEANIEGDILCVQADVVAQGRTAAILLTISDKDGKEKLAYPVTDSKYIGKLNIDGFHVHVAIAGKDVEEGDLLTMSVTDAEGQTTSVKKEITAEEDDDEDEGDEHHHHEDE